MKALSFSTKFVLICSIVFLFNSCKQKDKLEEVHLDHQVDKFSLVLDQQQGIVIFEGKRYSGAAVDLYDNEQIAESVAYVEGKKHGPSKKYFDNGVLSFEANYSQGKLDGLSKSYWKDGSLRSATFFVEGIVHGTQRQWYKSGQLFKELNYNMGVEEGMQKAWRENGAIYNNYEAKNGRIFGLKRAALCYELEEEMMVYEN